MPRPLLHYFVEILNDTRCVDIYTHVIFILSLVVQGNSQLWLFGVCLFFVLFALQEQYTHGLYVALINAFSGTVFVALLSGPRLTG